MATKPKPDLMKSREQRKLEGKNFFILRSHQISRSVLLLEL